jgi:hypothetical protein
MDAEWQQLQDTATGDFYYYNPQTGRQRCDNPADHHKAAMTLALNHQI